MRYENAKGPSVVKLDGIKVDFDMVDGTLRAVSFTDGKGNHVKIVREGYSGMECLVPAKPKTEERFVLHGEVEDIGAVRKVFKYKHEAEAAQGEIESKLRITPDLKIEKADLLIDDAGEPVTDDMPF
jgi:hypothetical protein